VREEASRKGEKSINPVGTALPWEGPIQDNGEAGIVPVVKNADANVWFVGGRRTKPSRSPAGGAAGKGWGDGVVKREGKAIIGQEMWPTRDNFLP